MTITPKTYSPTLVGIENGLPCATSASQTTFVIIDTT